MRSGVQTDLFSCSAQPCAYCSSHDIPSPSIFLKQAGLASSPEPLRLLCPLPGMFFPLVSTWLPPSSHLHSNIVFSVQVFWPPSNMAPCPSPTTPHFSP